MGFHLEMGSADLAACRFTLSPLYETLVAVRVLSGTGPGADPAAERWLERKRARYESLRRRVPMINVLAALHDSPEYSPTFLAPPPLRPGDTFARQIQAMRATPTPVARAELTLYLDTRARSVSPALLATLTAPDVVQRLATAMEAAWHELIRPDWPVIQTILQNDLQYRARQLVSRGWRGTLPHMSAGALAWRTRHNVHTLVFCPQNDVEMRCLPGCGATMFGPSMGADTSIAAEPGWQREIRYPARGWAGLIETVPQPASDSLARVIGWARAHLLCALDQPATTTQLTRQHHLSLGATGHHLSALRSAGLIMGIREGQSVIYSRTPLGDALVNANVV